MKSARDIVRKLKDMFLGKHGIDQICFSSNRNIIRIYTFDSKDPILKELKKIADPYEIEVILTPKFLE